MVLGTRLPCSMSIPKPGENPYQWLQCQVYLSRFYILRWSARIQRANHCLFDLKAYQKERDKRNEYATIQNITLLSILNLVYLSFLALLFKYYLQTHFLLQDETCKSKTQVWSERIKSSITIRFPWSGGASDRDGARYKEALISGYNTSYDLVGRKSKQRMSMVINSETAHCSDIKHGQACVGLTFSDKITASKTFGSYYMD